MNDWWNDPPDDPEEEPEDSDEINEPEPRVRGCPHGSEPGECDECDRESDFLFDCDRERRFFGR